MKLQNLILSLDETQGGSFIGVQNYLSKGTGELANYVINGKISYSNCVQSDIKTLKETQLYIIPCGEFTQAELKLAIEKLLDSLTKPNSTRSQAQSDAYVRLGNGLKLAKETGNFHIDGLLVSKNVIEKGEYKIVNSSKLTLAKKYIQRYLNLKTAKYRTFIIPNSEGINLKGIKIPV